jgi:asparagine synthase (glutamine-hydrolysing)
MADVKINLVRNSGYEWKVSGGVHFKGYIIVKGEYLEGKKGSEYLNSLFRDNEISSNMLRELNGVFAFVYENGKMTCLCTDRTRSFPLFYSADGEFVFVSDDPAELKTDSREMNDAAVKPFLYAGYVPGRETLLKNVFQVQAGEIVSIGKNGIKAEFYHSCINAADDGDEEQLEIGLKNIFEAIGAEMAEALKGKTAVVPLSSGYDSRLIAALLKMNGIDNVVTFTYGRKDNPELEISRAVASKLGYDWKFIEYTDEKIKGFLGTDDFKKYFPRSSNYTSMFYLQEYFAFHELLRELKGDAVIIPGHSGDSIAGSHVTETMTATVSKQDLEEIILQKHFIYRKTGPGVKKELTDLIGRILSDKTGLDISDYQNWIIKERHAKFVINSNRIYDHFGYRYYMPLVDSRFMDLFDRVPVSLKYGKKLYDNVLRKYFFEPLGLNFSYETNPTTGERKVQNAKNVIKKIMPKKIINFYKEKVRINSDIYFNIGVTDEMKEDMVRSGAIVDETGENRNSIIIQWYIHQLINNRF